MSATLVENHRPEPDPIADAIAALTTAARATRTVGAGTANEHAEPVDFADVTAHVLTAVAANIGGAETLLSGRSGSWEADLVRQLVTGTAGAGEADLMRFRTEPLYLTLDVHDVFDGFGIAELHDVAERELYQREDAAADALFLAVATPEERARIEQVRLAVGERVGDEVPPELLDEAQAIVAAVTERAESEDHPLAVAATAAEDASARLRELWQQDQYAYREAYAAAVRQALTARGLTLTVDVIEPAPDGAPEPIEPLAEELHAEAVRDAVLPMTGQTPDSSQGSPADALRREHLTYLDRVNAPA